MSNLEEKNKCYLIENIAGNLIFIDGITRCGKSVFSSIISSFENMEHIQFMTQLEHLIPSVMLGEIKENYARMMLRLLLNELAYNIQLSRNINFREKDQTGVANYKEPDIYWERLKLDDGNGIIEYLRNNDISIPFQTHDLMVNLDVVDAMDIDYKIIEIYRNPIDNIYSWWARGWGERFSEDPRSFTLLTFYNGNALPWYCVGYEEKVINLNPYEKCVMMGMDLIKRSVNQQKNAKDPNRILTIRFEDMVQNPSEQLSRIELFLNKKTTKYTNKFVEDAGCPRKLVLTDRENKLSILEKNIDSELFSELLLLVQEYEKDKYFI